MLPAKLSFSGSVANHFCSQTRQQACLGGKTECCHTLGVPGGQETNLSFLQCNVFHKNFFIEHGVTSRETNSHVAKFSFFNKINLKLTQQ